MSVATVIFDFLVGQFLDSFVLRYSVPLKMPQNEWNKLSDVFLFKIDERSAEFFALLEFPLCGHDLADIRYSREENAMLKKIGRSEF